MKKEPSKTARMRLFSLFLLGVVFFLCTGLPSVFYAKTHSETLLQFLAEGNNATQLLAYLLSVGVTIVFFLLAAFLTSFLRVEQPHNLDDDIFEPS